MHNLRHKRPARKACAATSGSSQQANVVCAASHGLGGASASSQQANAGSANSQRLVAASVTGSGNSQRHDVGVNSQVSTGAGDECNEAVVNTLAREVPPNKARGRGKKNRTQFRLPPRDGKIELVPKGTKQFAYANYHPKEYKYGSQVGVILKRLYPGGIDVRDEEGNVVGQRPALLWFDYFCKMDERGVTNARLVKQEFWSVFSVTRQNIRKANRNLESYLAKRVSDMMYQARLDAVKDHEGCNDDKARNILLTEEQYLNCRLDWCPMDARALLAKYWVSKEFLERRLALQAARAKSNEDMAQNRGGSRPWSETQQLLECKYGPERAGTLNTYAVMKSGFKNVDSTGRSARIRNVKAKKRLDDYTARAQPAENSKELDGRVLYSMENGMRHGRLPIADGAVGKENVMALAKSNRFHSTNTAAYLSAIEENEQLKEAFQQLKQSNAQLKETNDILLEENSVGRDLSMRLYEQLNKQAPPDLLARLAGLEAHRNKIK